MIKIQLKMQTLPAFEFRLLLGYFFICPILMITELLGY